VVGADGTTAQTTIGTTTIGTNLGTTAIMTVVHPDGTITTNIVAGIGTSVVPVVVAPDGIAYQSVTDHSTYSEPYKTTITVVHADGTTTKTTTTPDIGAGAGFLVVSADGTAYQAMHAHTGTVLTTSILVLHRDGTTTTTPVGADVNVQVAAGANGTVAHSDYYYDVTDQTYKTSLTAIHPDGTTTSTPTMAGVPVGGPQFGADGTTAQTVTTGAGTTSDPRKTTVAVIHPDGTTTSTTVAGQSSALVTVGVDGTAAQITRGSTGTGTAGDPWQTSVTVIHPDGTTTTQTVTGNPASLNAVVGADGTVALTVFSGTGTGTPMDPHQATVVVIHPNGAVTTKTLDGFDFLGAVVGPDGTVYQTSEVSDGASINFKTTVTVIHPDETITAKTITGSQGGNNVIIGADGAAYETTMTLTGNATNPYPWVVTTSRVS
jgi:hypothetical protein